MSYRIEKDSMGEVQVPADAYWAAQTARAYENFVISGYRMPAPLIQAIAVIKKASALANGDLGLIDAPKVQAIATACDEIAAGQMSDQFPLDVFQTGSATSTNMNVNEVVANRVCELMGGVKGQKGLCHPNDDVNRGQSSNDVIPTAVYVSAAVLANGMLLPALDKLTASLKRKEQEFADVIKIGRTHLMDAVPMTLGQEFSGYRAQIEAAAKRVRQALEGVYELPLGGTALGTGINTHPEFAKRAVAYIASETKLPFVNVPNLFEGIAAKDAGVFFSGALNTLAVSLMKIANDIRILSSGPRCGIAEINLPSLQPGSSIMPGKVNPVIPEAVIQVAAKVMGNNTTVTVAGQSGMLDLNVMMPVMAYAIIESVTLLASVSDALAEKCVDGIEADRERCAELVEWSMAIVTPLALKVGYDKAAELAYEAHKKRKTVKDVVREKGLLSDAELDAIFDPKTMI